MTDYVMQKGGIDFRPAARQIAEEILTKRSGMRDMPQMNRNDTTMPGEGVIYRARRSAAGIGLPYELTDKSFFRVMERYARRVGKDTAFYRNVESVPEMRDILGVPDPNTGNIQPTTKLQNIAGTNPIQTFMKLWNLEYLRDEATSRIPALVNSTIVQSPSRIIDAYTSVFGAFMRHPGAFKSVGGTLDAVKAYKDMFFSFKPIWDEAFRTGYMARTPGLNSALDTIIAEKDWSERLYSLSRALNLSTGAFHIEAFSHIPTYAVATRAIPYEISRAAKGDVAAARWLRELGITSLNPDENMLIRAKVKFDRQVTGDYSPEAQPSWLLNPKDPRTWAFGLMKYSVSIHRNVSDLVQNRDWGTLAKLMTITPMVFYAGNEAWKIMFGKERLPGASLADIVKQIPNVENKGFFQRMDAIAKDDNLRNATINRISGMLQSCGLWGGAVELAYLPFAFRNGGRQGQAVNVPAVDYVNQLIRDTVNASKAYFNGDANLMEVMGQYATDTAYNRSQFTRMIAYQYANHVSDDPALKQRYLDRIRRSDAEKFIQLTGIGAKSPDNSIPLPNNYTNLREHRLESAIKNQNIPEAQEWANEMTLKVFNDIANGVYKTPDEIKSAINKMVQPSRGPEPSNTDALEFAKYIDFKRRTFGQDSAKQFIEDWARQKALPKLKEPLIQQGLIKARKDRQQALGQTP
jgi:hypothetical protein